MSPLLLALFMISPQPPQLSLAPPRADAPLLGQSWSCTPRKTCGRIRSCDEAYWYLENCAWGPRLDGDSDGVPCESICGSH